MQYISQKDNRNIRVCLLILLQKVENSGVPKPLLDIFSEEESPILEPRPKALIFNPYYINAPLLT